MNMSIFAYWDSILGLATLLISIVTGNYYFQYAIKRVINFLMYVCLFVWILFKC